jgi:signal transduction histidine kinase
MNGSVVVSVKDRGVGIAAADLPRLFERFSRAKTATDGKFAGNGLGLSIVKKLVERSGGRIEAESRAGEGSTFRVKLPALN